MGTNLLYDAIVISNNVKLIHLCAIGNKFDRIHSIANEYYEKLSNDIDLIAELYKELNMEVKNFNIACEYSNIKVLQKDSFDWDEAINWIYKYLALYIEKLIRFRETVPSDIQSELDTIIRYWKKENNYKNKNRLKEN